jgi:hypothetical protein
MRDLGQVLAHIHDAEDIEIEVGPGPPSEAAYNTKASTKPTISTVRLSRP